VAVDTALRSAGYAERTVWFAALRLRRLAETCAASGGVYSPEVGARFVSDTAGRTGPSADRRKRRAQLVRLADGFLVSGVVDLSMARRPGQQPVSSAARRLLVVWETRMRQDGWAEATVAQHLRYARRFLIWLEQSPGGSLDGAALSSVDGFLVSLRATCAPSSMRTIKNLLAAFTRFAGRDDLAAGFAAVRTQRKRCPLPMLTGEQADLVAQACGRAGLRDAAITVLALTTGLRACDIRALKLDDIDWRAGRISIVQAKTGNPLTIPLPPAAGNAISAYLLGSRPNTTDRCVFVRSIAPHTGFLTSSAVRAVLGKVFGDAGVRPPVMGTRLIRHHLASSMLTAQVGLPTIAAVLGHADPASANAYLDMDAEQLRACVLPLPETVLS